jgi:tRNA pseudouridine55 synthase
MQRGCRMGDLHGTPPQQGQSKSRRFYREVDGILLLDKSLGLSSNAALQQARGLFGALKAGHAGSLDPLASGLLPVCFGQATKVCGRLLNAGKTYRVTVQLGARTESLDCETGIVERAPIPALDEQRVDAVLATFMGEQDQVPPMHSALKQDGKRLYELARRGENVERAARRITIYQIQRVQLTADQLEFEVRCSKGTYIRSLSADIAAKLGTLGYVAVLRRLTVEPFAGQPMYTLLDLEARLGEGPASALDSLLLAADAAFLDLTSTQLGRESERDLLRGQTVGALVSAPVGQLRAYGSNGRFLGLVEGQPDGRVRPVRLFVDAAGV